MFARIKVSGKNQYLQLVENHREASRTVQRVICTLGRLDELEATGSIDALLRSLARFHRQIEPGEMNRAELTKKAWSPGPGPAFDRARQPAKETVSIPPGGERHGSAQLRQPSHTQDPSPSRSSVDRDKVDILKASPIFGGVDEEHLIELAGLAFKRTLNAGQFLYFEGDPPESSDLIVSGILKLLRHSPSGADFISAIYGPGELLGNIVLIGNGDQPHPSSAQAVVETELLSISSSDLRRFLKRHPKLNAHVLARMLAASGQRRQAATARLREMAGEKIEHRLARVLLGLHLALGATIPLTRHEIAEMTGTSTETAARFISRLARTGIVRSLRARVIVIDQNGLRQLAEAP